jgi:hypothetical protein
MLPLAPVLPLAVSGVIGLAAIAASGNAAATIIAITLLRISNSFQRMMVPCGVDHA